MRFWNGSWFLPFMDEEGGGGGGETPPAAVEKVEDQIEKADDAADKAVEKITAALDKVAEILLDPDTTGAEKKALLDSLEGITPKLMEVTDKWFALESELSTLKTQAFAGQPTAEPPGEQAASSSASPTESMDNSPPAEIPVVEPAQPQKAENPLMALLRRLW